MKKKNKFKFQKKITKLFLKKYRIKKIKFKKKYHLNLLKEIRIFQQNLCRMLNQKLFKMDKSKKNFFFLLKNNMKSQNPQEKNQLNLTERKEQLNKLQSN